ncbi:MAG: YqaA family protein [Phycisphaerae bacterium]
MTEDEDVIPSDRPLPDQVSVLRWFVFFGVVFVGGVVALVLLLGEEGWQGSASLSGVAEAMEAMSPAAKLLVFGLYVSVCTTFLPLPTSAVAAAVSTHELAVAGTLWGTTLLVATVGAVCSTLANLNDYHLFTWMLRSRHVAKVRHTRTYEASAKWFARAPFFLLVVFNLIPIPVDVIRMLASTYRYPRVPFAAANFVGRFLRYGIIAGVTYWASSRWENAGRIAVLSLLAVALGLGLGRLVARPLRRFFSSDTNDSSSGESDSLG